MSSTDMSIPKPETDQYGGVIARRCAQGRKEHFYTEKSDGEWWLCTPQGHAFWMAGVYFVGASKWVDELGNSHASRVRTKFGSDQEAWPQASRRLKSWGFNVIGPGSYRMTWPNNYERPWPGDHTNPVKMPFLLYAGNHPAYSSVRLGVAKNIYGLYDSEIYGRLRGSLPDPYDPSLPQYLEVAFRNDRTLAANATSPWYIGSIGNDGDYLTGFGAGSDFPTDPKGKTSEHNAFHVLIASPLQQVNPSSTPAWSLYGDTSLHAKEALRDFLRAKYVTISALNRAWNSAYSGWESSGTSQKEQFAVGTGTQGYTGDLKSGPISRFSLRVFVGGTVAGGDDGTGAVRGPGIASGRVDYGTGTINLTFSAAVTAGAPIVAEYIRNGWGRGSGLMDENGHHPWIGNKHTLAGFTNAAQSDLNEFLERMTEKYLCMERSAYKKVAPKSLYGSTTYFGGWRSPARAPVLRAAGRCQDIVFIGSAATQDQLDFVAANAGDVPIVPWVGAIANPDSGRWRHVTNLMKERPTYSFSTQRERGSWFANEISNMIRLKAQLTGSRQYVGYLLWQYDDNNREQQNWGLVSFADNAYDGQESITRAHKDTFGYYTFAEEKDYGDCLGPIKRANSLWKRVPPRNNY